MTDTQENHIKDETASNETPSLPETTSASSGYSRPSPSRENPVQRSVKPEDWPLKDIKEPHDNDVLYGRGGGTNHHPGNKRYRKIVEDKKVEYINSKRLDKPLVALNIIKEWRAQDPPGRFLKVDDRTGLWNDVGDKKAREKTSQALREKAPLLRKQQEEEKTGSDSGDDGDTDKPKMARDHSLGTELLTSDQAVTLEGFSWQEPLKEGGQGSRCTSQGSLGTIPPPPHGLPGTPYASGQYRYPSHGSFDPRMYPGNWGAQPPGAPPYPPPYPHISGGWSSRDNSLGHFPLAHASVAHPAAPFDTRMYPGHYYPQPPSPHGMPPYHYSNGPPPPGYHVGPPPPHHGSYPGYLPVSPRQHRSPSSSPRRSNPSTPYNLDPKVASAWSGQPEAEIVRQLSTDEPEHTLPAIPALKSSDPEAGSLRPDAVKRITSNNNETPEVKPDLGPEYQVKRVALNRDSSAAANRLKELTFPGKFKNGKFDALKEVTELSKDMGRSTLESPTPAPIERESTALDFLEPLDLESSVRLKTLTEEQRLTTFDQISQDLMRPSTLHSTSRITTIEALAIDFDADPLVQTEKITRKSTAEMVFEELVGGPSRPGALSFQDRITTSDIMDIVNEPIMDDDPFVEASR